MYCKSEIFTIILFSQIALKDILTTLKKVHLGLVLPLSIKDRFIWPFLENFIFMTLRIIVKMKPS